MRKIGHPVVSGIRIRKHNLIRYPDQAIKMHEWGLESLQPTKDLKKQCSGSKRFWGEYGSG